MNISTEYWPKPGPDRRFDWTAIDSDTYDGADDAGAARAIGVGRTEREAEADLLERFDDGEPWQQEAAREYRVANGPLGVGA